MGISALVIGNGESRINVCLSEISKDNITIGCNAIHRDFTVDHLVCCDARMVRESLENPNTKNSSIYVRDNWYLYFKKIQKNKNIKLVPPLPYYGTGRADNPINWGSGPYAVLIAANLEVKEITLVGFDLYGNQSLVNNCYKDTTHYQGKDSREVDPSYWIYQLAKIFMHYPHIEFKILNNENWQLPKEWQHKNVKKYSLGLHIT